VDLVGGINCYRFKLSFGDSSLKVALNERTGLNEESFDGVQQR